MKFTSNILSGTRILRMSRQTTAVLAMLLALGTTATVGTASMLLAPAPASAAVVSGGDTPTAEAGGGASRNDITSASTRALTLVRTVGASVIAMALVVVCVWAACTRRFTLAAGSLGFCVLAALMITDAGYDLVVNTAARLV